MAQSEGASRQPEQVKAFRDTWELGIHSYLAYLRDRLLVAHELLSETGSVFVQIGDDNLHLVRSLLDEVFGAENFCSQIQFVKTSGAGSPSLGTSVLASVADFVIWFAKDKERVKYRQLYKPRELTTDSLGAYTLIEDSSGGRRRMTPQERANLASISQESRIFRGDNLTSQSGVEKTRYPVDFEGRTFRPTKGVWKTSEAGMARLKAAKRLILQGNTLSYVRYWDDFPATALNNVWTDTVIAGFADEKTYVVQTSTKVVQRCLLMTSDPGDLVLDPTCGSGTTAVVAEQWGRRWITIDTSRVALALARNRLMAAKYPFYLLADSRAGAAKQSELTGVPETRSEFAQDIRQGFVCRRLPHITLKSIANNDEIVEGLPADRIRSVISRAADAQTMYDQPFEDASHVRVSGPFTVESLSPHRMLEADSDTVTGTIESPSFASMILDNLKRAGVQNMRRDERLEFETVETYAGEWLNAVGGYTDAAGVGRRVAISIGPEHGTVGSEQVKEAAKEAVRGIGFDLLVVLGFAFDAQAGKTAMEISPDTKRAPEFAAAEATRQYGKLQVLLARMNPDLAMGDELLKKTGAGNLFMVFGEPDVQVRSQDGGTVVEVLGVDVYDPTTGQVRSDSTADIACWFVDTNYNGESFFVRHAYFTGAGDPYAKLKRALKADIDEAAWGTLYSTVSRPFDRPQSGKIAVKVINHYGDEVMKVYEV